MSDSNEYANSLVGTIHNNLLTNPNEHDALTNAATGENISYQELFTYTCKLAGALKMAGVKQNDVISICSENSIYFFEVVIATLYIGATSALINHMFTTREILHAISISKPKIMFCSRECLNKVLTAKQEAPFLEKIIVIDSEENDVESLKQFTNFNKHFDSKEFLPLANINMREQLAFILYSSGTTGLPKGVMITHYSFMISMTNLKNPQLYSQASIEKIFTIYSFSSVGGILYALGGIFHTQQIILLPKFEENMFLLAIEKYRVTELAMPPTLAVFLTRTDLINQYDISSIKLITCGGSVLTEQVEEAIEKRLNVRIRRINGLTETMTIFLMPLTENRRGSVGKITVNVSVKAINTKSGAKLGPNQNGELCFKGEIITKGYINNEGVIIPAVDEDGWFHSGDIGYYHEDGYFFITDRFKELIKYKAFQVPPAELEQILVMHPKIKSAGVVGLPDDVAGELPFAFVVKELNTELTESDVQNFVADQVSSQKRLRGGVMFVDELPIGGTGKLIRWKLREMLKNLNQSSQ